MFLWYPEDLRLLLTLGHITYPQPCVHLMAMALVLEEACQSYPLSPLQSTSPGARQKCPALSHTVFFFTNSS